MVTETSIRAMPTGLVLGIVSAIVSFLFFGRAQDVYLFLLTGGSLVSVVCFLAILLRKGTAKSKLLWTAVVIVAIAVQQLVEPALIKGSYLIFLSRHKQELAAVNELLDKPGNVTVLNNEVYDKDDILSSLERSRLLALREQLDVYLIDRSDKGVHYGLWGFLDVRLGLIWWTGRQAPGAGNRHLTGNWYY